VITCPFITHEPNVYVNVDDVRRGIDPPRAKMVWSGQREEDVTGTVTLDDARRNPFLRP
jgi:hypothetical protein